MGVKLVKCTIRYVCFYLVWLPWWNYIFRPESLGAAYITVTGSRSYQSFFSFLSPSPPDLHGFGKLPSSSWIFKLNVAIYFDYDNWQLLIRLLTLMNLWHSWWNMSTLTEQITGALSSHYRILFLLQNTVARCCQNWLGLIEFWVHVRHFFTSLCRKCVFQRRWVRFDGESLAYYNNDKVGAR